MVLLSECHARKTAPRQYGSTENLFAPRSNRSVTSQKYKSAGDPVSGLSRRYRYWLEQASRKVSTRHAGVRAPQSVDGQQKAVLSARSGNHDPEARTSVCATPSSELANQKGSGKLRHGHRGFLCHGGKVVEKLIEGQPALKVKSPRFRKPWLGLRLQST